MKKRQKALLKQDRKESSQDAFKPFGKARLNSKESLMFGAVFNKLNEVEYFEIRKCQNRKMNESGATFRLRISKNAASELTKLLIESTESLQNFMLKESKWKHCDREHEERSPHYLDL